MLQLHRYFLNAAGMYVCVTRTTIHVWNDQLSAARRQLLHAAGACWRQSYKAAWHAARWECTTAAAAASMLLVYSTRHCWLTVHLVMPFARPAGHSSQVAARLVACSQLCQHQQPGQRREHGLPTQAAVALVRWCVAGSNHQGHWNDNTTHGAWADTARTQLTQGTTSSHSAHIGHANSAAHALLLPIPITALYLQCQIMLWSAELLLAMHALFASASTKPLATRRHVL